MDSSTKRLILERISRVSPIKIIALREQILTWLINHTENFLSLCCLKGSRGQAGEREKLEYARGEWSNVVDNFAVNTSPHVLVPRINYNLVPRPNTRPQRDRVSLNELGVTFGALLLFIPSTLSRQIVRVPFSFSISLPSPTYNFFSHK